MTLSYHQGIWVTNPTISFYLPRLHLLPCNSYPLPYYFHPLEFHRPFPPTYAHLVDPTVPLFQSDPADHTLPFRITPSIHTPLPFTQFPSSPRWTVLPPTPPHVPIPPPAPFSYELELCPSHFSPTSSPHPYPPPPPRLHLA